MEVCTSERMVGECPIASVKTAPVVDKRRRVLLLLHIPPVDCLPPIRIPSPLVKSQHPWKFVQIPDLTQHRQRQIAHDVAGPWTGETVPRPKLKTRLARCSFGMIANRELRRMFYEPLAHQYQRRLGHRQSNQSSQ